MVMAEQKFEGSIPDPIYLLGVKVHYHSIFDYCCTGGDRSISTLNFNKAKAA
jgi:hypothetical protein